MKAILIFLAGLLFPITFLFGQSAIQKYAGTAMPYPFIKNLSVLNHDGMVPFYINHLGRHGARFPTSGKALEKVRNVLILAEQEKRLTVKGQELLATVLRLSEAFEGQWGELSAVGEQEQKGIAERMLLRYPQIFVDSARIEAIASYIPRCISSMDAFLSGQAEAAAHLSGGLLQASGRDGFLRTEGASRGQSAETLSAVFSSTSFSKAPRMVNVTPSAFVHVTAAV